MLPKIILAFLCLIGLHPILIKAQVIKVEYFEFPMTRTTDQRYDIKREWFKRDSGFIAKDFNRKSKQLFTGEFSSIDPLVENGQFRFFNKKGLIEAEGNYVDGEMTGQWKFYDQKGKLINDLNYDLPNIKCIHPPKVSVNDSTLVNTNLTFDETLPSFQNMSPNSYYIYIYDHITFPPYQKKYFRSGKVIVRFTIGAHGNVCDVESTGNAHMDLHIEAKRIVWSMDQWEPAKKGDKPVVVRMELPIIFGFK